MTVRASAPIAALAAAALSVAAAARADYKESYRKGIEAADRGDWAEVARRMREALAEQPKEGERLKLYGMRFEAYLPHYWLGLALFNGQDCAGAVGAWRVSQGQGAVQRTSQFKTLKSSQAECEKRLAQAAPPKPSAAPSRASSPVAEPSAAPPVRRAGADAGKTVEAPRPTETPRPDEARRAADTSTPAPGRTPPGPTALPVKPAGPAGPPAPLLAAAQAYFNGRYREAAEALGATSYTGREGVQALVLRAAARYALYVVSGEKDDKLRQDALADVKACRRLDPSFTPDRKAFSPRFVQLFTKGG